MASSDDEGEALPSVVSDYYFLDDNDEPVSFSELPLMWDDAETFGGCIKEIGLRGTTDNGLQKIFEQVTAWKFDISFAKPEIFVLSKKENWIKLIKPRKSFEETIRTIFITVHALHFVKRNPEASDKAFWDHLSKVFSLYEPRPTENDFVDHMDLIDEAVKRDEILARSQVLVTFLAEKPRKKKVLDEVTGTNTMFDFIVDADNEENAEDGSDIEEEDFFEHVCAICDNGGDILCCEGKCLRSFHATLEAGSESSCYSLGFSDEHVKAIANLTFECKNCLYKQHQCFVCGELGSSNKSAGAEVFQCVTGTCGYFYHPRCVANALVFKHGDKSKDFESEIAAGKPFVCPLHFCYACKELEPEDKKNTQMQFAVCRRCPRAYHRKCLPEEITFEDDEDQGILQRAWLDLMPNKILMYCLKHKIDDDLQTPIRNHIKFPYTEHKKEVPRLEKIVPKKTIQTSEDTSRKKIIAKPSKGIERSSAAKRQVDSSTREVRLSAPTSLKKQKLADNSKVALKKTLSGKQNKSSGDESEASLGERLYALWNKDSMPIKLVKGETSDSSGQKKTRKPVAEEMNDSVKLDADSEKRIFAIIKEAESSVRLQDVERKYQAPLTHGYSSKHVMQNITLGKVEGSIEALHAALQKLEEGGSLEDAKAVCEPGLLSQINKWKNKLRVYLSPYLHGMRYTSFGRHFTKVEKLQSIVNKLHWYVQGGEMIVDFCCGTNDFSCLMKEKLDEMGKSCLYKNYDIFPAKTDFNFEKRDWMTVRPSELPPGSQLIMGLNPPFGVNAALANKFIDKALEFNPKLLILIVPREAGRLDKKKPSYDLVWEDHNLLFGKAFYLPGSTDVNDKQVEDWNASVPPLSLWSRSDWTAEHVAIAQRYGHLSRAQERKQSNESQYKMDVPDFKAEANDLHSESDMLAGDQCLQDVKQLQEQGAKVSESHMQEPCGTRGIKENDKIVGRGKEQTKDNLKKGNKSDRKRTRESEEKSSEEHKIVGRGKEQATDTLDKGQRSDRKHGRVSEEKSSEEHKIVGRGKEQDTDTLEKGNKSDMKRRRGSEEKSADERRSLPRCSSPSKAGGRSLGSHLSRRPEMQSHADVQREGYHHFDPVSGSGSQMQLQRGYVGYQDEGMGRRKDYSREPYLNREDRRPHPVDPGSDNGFRIPDCYQRQPGNVHRYGAYTNEGYGREADIRAQVRLYGHQDPDSLARTNNYSTMAGPGFHSSHGQLGAMADSAYNIMNSSTMQRYAPRLDELNHTRMNNVGSVQHLAGGNGMYGSAPRPGFPTDSMGFAPGPYRPFSQRNSSGWLNE